MSFDFAIQARNLGKCYQIYEQPFDRLKQSFWRSKRRFYQEFWVLRDVSFEIRKGETVGIIGSNGSGKSTLLQLLCGTLNPTEGEVTLNGRVAALLELGAGFNLEFTGRENVYMNGAIMGLSTAEMDSRYDEIAAFANIGSFIEQPVKTYSSGMYVRLAFATAINVSPDILVVDEALAVGDIRFQQKCMARIKKFCQTGTVIFVSHDTAAVIELCSRAFWIESGKIRFDGAPKFVVEKYLQYMSEGDSKQETILSERSQCPSGGYNMSGFSPITDDIRQYGDRRVTIEAVRFLCSGANGVAYAGQECEVGVMMHAYEEIANPIVGYVVKDRLGREIFADNTAFIRDNLTPLSAGKKYVIKFRIGAWPNLVEGYYTLSLAVADGRIGGHVQCHWLHDALVIKSIPVKLTVGMFSVQDTDVTFLEVND
jgi:lipopolysaccharide transport system ATP-binding protein